MKIRITISSMATDWDDNNNNPEIPAIDPNPYVPNDSPSGTDAERAHFMKKIQYINPLISNATNNIRCLINFFYPF